MTLRLLLVWFLCCWRFARARLFTRKRARWSKANNGFVGSSRSSYMVMDCRAICGTWWWRDGGVSINHPSSSGQDRDLDLSTAHIVDACSTARAPVRARAYFTAPRMNAPCARCRARARRVSARARAAARALLPSSLPSPHAPLPRTSHRAHTARAHRAAHARIFAPHALSPTYLTGFLPPTHTHSRRPPRTPPAFALRFYASVAQAVKTKTAGEGLSVTSRYRLNTYLFISYLSISARTLSSI